MKVHIPFGDGLACGSDAATAIVSAEQVCASCRRVVENARAFAVNAAVDVAKRTKPVTSPDANGFYTWKVELTIRVHKTWVEDGFDASERFSGDGARRFGENMLPHATGDEVEVTGRVVSAPNDEAIAEVQGYPNVDAWQETRRK